MDLGIKGKTAIVCASSKGLGKGCAAALAEAGCDVVLNGRDASVLSATAADLRNRFGVKVSEIAGDVSLPDVQKALIAAAPKADILVNNNGGPPRRDFYAIDRDAIVDGVTRNMITPIELIQALLGGMTERGFGRIVNITSLSVYMPIDGLDVSSGARAGLTAFLGGIARRVASHNVTINNLLPGKIDTDRLKSSFPADVPREKRLAQLVADIPGGRLGTAEEFGQVCAFLCSVHAGYLTGQNIPVDGGLYTSAF